MPEKKVIIVSARGEVTRRVVLIRDCSDLGFK